MRFEWDDANEAHVGRRMDRETLEWVMTKGRPLLLGFQVVNDELRRLAVATDVSGSLWVVIYTIRSARLRPVTTFPAKPVLAQMYQEKRS